MKLLAPLSYLRIKHDEKKLYDYWFPLFCAAVISVVYLCMDEPFSLLGKGGLVPQVNGLLQVLIGFYIAALAAIATFANPSIDEKMAGKAPVIKELYRGKVIEVPLIRRRFLCYLFGYLSLVSFIVFGFGLVASLFTKSITSVMELVPYPKALLVTKTVFLFSYSFILFNMICTTLLGLYYLAVRIHQPND